MGLDPNMDRAEAIQTRVVHFQRSLFPFFHVLSISFITDWIIPSKEQIADIANELSNLLSKIIHTNTICFVLTYAVWGLGRKRSTKFWFMLRSKSLGTDDLPRGWLILWGRRWSFNLRILFLHNFWNDWNAKTHTHSLWFYRRYFHILSELLAPKDTWFYNEASLLW